MQKPLLQSLFIFIKNPRYCPKAGDSKGKKFTKIYRLWAIGLFLATVLGIFGSQLFMRLGFEPLEHSILDIFLTAPGWMIFLLAVIWAPIFEELAFRLALRFSPLRLGFAAGFFLLTVFVALQDILQFNLIFWELDGWWGIIQLLTLGLLFVLFVGYWTGFFIKRWNENKKVEQFYSKNFRFIFYSSALVFGLIHVLNYSGMANLAWFASALLVLPQAFLGLVLGFTRVKLGIVWSMLLHAMHNGIAITPFLILKLASEETFEAMMIGRGMGDISSNDSMVIFMAFLFVVFAALLFLTATVWNIWELYNSNIQKPVEVRQAE